jgi:hypothetical protein
MPVRRRKHSRRGGFLGSLINTAAVPGTLLALQQTYKRKRTGGRSRSRGRSRSGGRNKRTRRR